MTVRVVSYNILVPMYADQPEYYCKCQPQFLKTDYRWKLIKFHLKEEIAHNENTIICLQELSLTLLPKIEVFFRRSNYMFFHNLYGWRHNDYMGIGIAIPVSMELKSMSVIKIGDHIRSFSKPRNKKIKATTGESHWNKSGTEIDTESISDPWETSMAKYNTLICVHVVVHDKPLFIGTYHMPSCYKEPDVMAIHASVVKDLMFQLAAGKNFILAGDFNITPGEVCYKTLTEKDYTNWNLPESSIYEISYRPLKEQILKSAYREKNGAEPAYTDYSHTLDSPNYCETIDYIFFNGRLTVQDVLELPNYPTGESYPDATHPSDHLMIAATFQLL